MARFDICAIFVICQLFSPGHLQQFPRALGGMVCRLPSDPFGVVESYLSGPAMLFQRHRSVPAGTIVKKSCKFGFAMSNNENRETLCTEAGTWSHTLGRCKPIACVLPNWLFTSESIFLDLDQSSIPFPGTKRLYKIGSHIHFICRHKEEVTFPSDIACLPNGHWNVRPPKECTRSYYNWQAYVAEKGASEKATNPI